AEAIEPLSRALTLEGESVETLENLGLAQHAEKKFADARDTYVRLAKLKPLEVDPLRRLAACQVALGEDADALATFATLAKLIAANSPDWLDVLESIAQCQERLGKVEESVASYERLLDVEPERVPARRALTMNYERLAR